MVKKKSRALVILAAIGLLIVGVILGASFNKILGSKAVRSAGRRLAERVAENRGMDMRNRVVLENPDLLSVFVNSGGFGGEFSQLVGLNMFSRDPEIMEEAAKKTTIEQVADRTWVIYMPFVNAILFETDEGLVLVDTGTAPNGPALEDAIRSVSDMPIHTIIYTHSHTDHAYGTWALVDEGANPRIVAQEILPSEFQRYIKTGGVLSRYMSQPLEQMPDSEDDMVWPTELFGDELVLTIGGEEFYLKHYRGETEDQLFVSVPGRGILCPADYYQGFIPNGGNGKRVQRFIEDWVLALREMTDLNADLMLPSHGQPVEGADQIRHNFTVLADALDSIVSQTLAGLNSGLRKDQVAATVVLPPELADEPTLKETYVSVQDISQMVINQYTGWWDDQPSHWSRPPLEQEAELIAAMAGGLDNLIAEGYRLAETDPALACVVADWAFLAAPNDSAVQDMVIEVYRTRILSGNINSQERLAYLDRIVEARTLQVYGE